MAGNEYLLPMTEREQRDIRLALIALAVYAKEGQNAIAFTRLQDLWLKVVALEPVGTTEDGA